MKQQLLMTEFRSKQFHPQIFHGIPSSTTGGKGRKLKGISQKTGMIFVRYLSVCVVIIAACYKPRVTVEKHSFLNPL